MVHGKIPWSTLGMAIKIRQKLKHKTPFNHMVLPQAILLNSCYSIFLRNWLKYFPREQIHLVNGNEISKLLNLPKIPKCYAKYFSRESGKCNDGCRKFRRSRKMVYGRQFRCQSGNWILLHQAAAKGCRTSLLNWWWKGEI